MGVIHKAWSELDGPTTEAEKKEQKEVQLLMGICDKEYWGEAYCFKWKQENWSVPMDPELKDAVSGFAMVRQMLCPRSSGSKEMDCKESGQELAKRYYMTDLVSSLTRAWVTVRCLTLIVGRCGGGFDPHETWVDHAPCSLPVFGLETR